MDYEKTHIAVIGHGSNKNELYDRIKEFSKDLNQSDIEKFLDEQYGINRISIAKLYTSIQQILTPIFDTFIAAGYTFEEIGKLIKNSEKSRSNLSKTIVLKKSSIKPYKQRRYKRFQNHR